MTKERLVKVLGVALLLALLVSACGAPGGGAPPEENVGVYAYMPALTTFDPTGTYSDEGMVLVNVYEPLVRYNPPGSDELISPVLAASWETNEDGTQWTFKLREGVKFHDGTDVNAEAVKYSIDKNIERGLGASYIWEAVQEIEVVDDYTVRFKLSHSAPLDLIASAHYNVYIISPTCDQAHDAAWYDEGNDCGSGPYVIESRERGQRTVMSRFDDYWGGWEDGQFHKIIVEEIEDPSVRQQRLEEGSVDVTLGLPVDNLESLDAREDVTVYSNPSFQTILGLYNHQKPPLDDKLVRQAISYAFPYEDYIAKVHMGYATQSAGPIPTTMFGHGSDLFQYNYDLDKAEELLAEAGYPGGGLDLVLIFTSGDLFEQQAAELWKAELAKVGVNLELREMGWEAAWDYATNSEPEDAQDIFLFYWWPDYVSPYSFLFNMFHCEEQPLWNLGYVCNPELDTTMDKAAELLGSDREESERLFIAAQEMLVGDADALFICDINNVHVMRSDIEGYVDNPAYPHSIFWYDLRRK
jgi:peptide/nickel transport system substrate-binding protein